MWEGFQAVKCPHCGSTDDKVIETRTLAGGEGIRRRRQCLSCGYRFTSYERIEEKPLMVIKKSGRREPFERGKIEKGILRAVEKLPVSGKTIEELVNRIEERAALYDPIAREVPTSVLGDMVLEELKALDFVAYIRFASVYKNFRDLKAFLEEIGHIQKTNNVTR
ncbi:Transcriptional repressor nrdR [Spirochaeta thermophila DSM 6578]|uniref:Transcriptional repressor NrdR n=1 Tax=Winmispira thermophila (strain ATCC 700085 / DSM 6578 / Z-1203) TaxID=869211 RepID=G0GA39_WINT7|nr:Transcriptional repressor nrdR [Spirochaeta thermophila DSM 6578]